MKVMPQKQKPLLVIDRNVDGMDESVFIPGGSNEYFLLPSGRGGGFLNNFRIKCIGLSDVAGGYEVGRRNSREHVVIIPVSGCGEYRLGSGMKPFTIGQAVIFPRGGEHFYSSSGSWTFIWLHVFGGSPWGLDRLISEAVITDIDTESLHGLFESVLTERREADQYSGGMIESYIRLIVYKMGRYLNINKTDVRMLQVQRLNRLWAEVDSRLAHRWTASELAGCCGMSKTGFCRLVKDLEGLTPLEKVRSIRLSRARELFEGGSYTLETIAPIVGFSSPFSLSRAYKKFFGRSPSHLLADGC